MYGLVLLLALSLSLSVDAKSALGSPVRSKLISSKPSIEVTALAPAPVASAGMPDAVKLMIGAGGIYGAFMYYGTLQEDIFSYKGEDGSKFKAVWLLQALEALANVAVGSVGMSLNGRTKGLPLDVFAMAGVFQVCAKAFTSMALAAGLSFPVVTLAKSGKMVPVMIGSLLLGGSSYTLREYLSVGAIIGGTMIVSMGNKKSSAASSSTLGLLYIVASLVCDGVTGGMQKRVKTKSAELGVKAKPYDFMFWTNLFMAATAMAFSIVTGDGFSGLAFIGKNPDILSKLLKFAACSAVGQSFIFYTITNFDPLVTTTVTTTRKVFSVLLSIFLNGHSMSKQGWAGLAVASCGILSELNDKVGGKKKVEATSPAKVADKKKK